MRQFHMWHLTCVLRRPAPGPSAALLPLFGAFESGPVCAPPGAPHAAFLEVELELVDPRPHRKEHRVVRRPKPLVRHRVRHR
eukprot:CAMPEP_0181261086 /NCGR_PEP_ID=MMETSP1097-20121128/1299_1 /TAXON_ID=35684 /ORGANISM="Pseudopedinella elastica, Strain CCMP716" /LENGTH=81 /DNA_ID=CAMNT_0023359663 /DNA_START=266 /DNA_END=508 /DNA_ORIENTATION=-